MNVHCQGNEIETRVKVGSNRKDTLEQLYNITGYDTDSLKE